MFGNFLKLLRAVELSPIDERAFFLLSKMLSTHKELVFKFKGLNCKFGRYDPAIARNSDAIRPLKKISSRIIKHSKIYCKNLYIKE